MNPMTIPKKIKGIAFSKKVKKTVPTRQKSKKTVITKDNQNGKKHWQKEIKIDFEDEFLTNSLLINNILE